MSTQSLIDTLKNALSAHAPFITGTCAIPADEFSLYYGHLDDARHIDLSKATSAQLQGLADACQPATFGLNKQDVLDESYRKAGKMDTSNFSSKFDIEGSGIMDHVRDGLVPGQGDVRAELYKLNVYGKDSFFKAHKDTPRGTDMFGSLVVFFPCAQTGGALLLRHEGQEWTFDSAEELSACAAPSIGYVAFYSDVEHEVALVTSGHRVTLTYNLYYNPPAARQPSLAIRRVSAAEAGVEAACKAALLGLLDDATILPQGGILGFGLHHEYPFDKAADAATPPILLDQLKGADALIKRACDQLALTPKLVCVYEDELGEIGNAMLSHGLIKLSSHREIEDLAGELLAEGAVTIRDPLVRISDSNTYSFTRQAPQDVYWATQPTANTSLSTSYLRYGNEASLSHYYANVSLVVSVGPARQRILPTAEYLPPTSIPLTNVKQINSQLAALRSSGADASSIDVRRKELKAEMLRERERLGFHRSDFWGLDE